MGVLNHKTAVITGGTRGFGLAIARAYAEEGAAVVIASRSEMSVEKAVQALRSEGAQVTGICCDVSQVEQVQALASHAIQTFGGFDIWINNAALSAPYGPTFHIPQESFINSLQTDIFGVYYGSLFAIQHFLSLSQPKGKLINILGRGDRQPVPMQNAYASSKAWVRSFTLALAKEYRATGVGIFAFNPGLMETELLERVEAVSGYEERLKPLETVMRLWAKPPEVPARKAVWLASPATDGKTGLEVRLLGFPEIVSGVFQEAVRKLIGKRAPQREIQVTIIPAVLPVDKAQKRDSI